MAHWVRTEFDTAAAAALTEWQERRVMSAMFERMAKALPRTHPAHPYVVHLGRLFVAEPERVAGDWGKVAAAAIEPMLSGMEGPRDCDE